MHPFSFSTALTTLKKYGHCLTLCPRALRPSMTTWGYRKHTDKLGFTADDRSVMSCGCCQNLLTWFEMLVRGRRCFTSSKPVSKCTSFSELTNTMGVLMASSRLIRSHRWFITACKNKMWACEQTNKEADKHAREFRGVTEATAEVIMLPPEPPITRSLPDFDSSMTGVIEEGGRSPMTTITLQIRAKRG